VTGTRLFVSSKVEPRARGRELGVTFRDEVAATWTAYQRIFADHDLDEALVREVATGTLAEVSAWGPALAGEIAGIAAGAGLEPWQVAALNARSEVLARYRKPVPGECSTAVFLPTGDAPRTVQTWDWHEALAGLTLLWQLQSRPDWTVKTFTEFGVLGKIGVNSAGLGLHFNLLQHDADGATHGVPVHLLARRILDEAATLEEAEALVRSAPVSASVALTVVTTDGAATFEVAPSGVRVLRPDADGFLFHTNHFVAPDLATHERLGRTDPDTYARQSLLGDRRALLSDPDLGLRATAMVCHEHDGAALCAHPGDPDDITQRWQTLVTIGLEVEKGRLTFRDGNPCGFTDLGAGWVEV
jgi:isopenicillin-N N-acyltransferase-like protein